jgi:hypothetical protein
MDLPHRRKTFLKQHISPYLNGIRLQSRLSHIVKTAAIAFELALDD